LNNLTTCSSKLTFAVLDEKENRNDPLEYENHSNEKFQRKFPINMPSKYSQIQIHSFIDILNQIKNVTIIPISREQKDFLRLLVIHQDLLDDLVNSNSPSHLSNQNQSIQMGFLHNQNPEMSILNPDHQSKTKEYKIEYLDQ
jgi:hypothetical protein